MGVDLPIGTSPWRPRVALVWFVLGYALYCSAYAAAGSLVSRVEDAQGVAFPIMLPLLFGYIVSFSAAGGASTLLWVLAFIPPDRGGGDADAVRDRRGAAVGGALSMALTVVAIVGVAMLAAKIYERSVLHSRKLSWREAFRQRGEIDTVTARTCASERPPADEPGQPGAGRERRRRGSSSPSRSPSMSAHPAMSRPSRLRRTTAVQWPYSVRSASGRAAATTSRPGRRSATSGERSARVVDPLGVVDDDECRRRPPAGRRCRRSTPGHDASGDRRSGATASTAPSGWASRHDAASRTSAVAPAAARRAGDEHVLAVRARAGGRAERLEVDADDELELAVGGHPPGRQLEGAARRAAAHRCRSGRGRAGPVVTGSTTASWASQPVEATTTRPAIAAGTERRATPHAVASAGSSRWNTQRSAHAASIAAGSAPGRSAVSTQAMPTAAPSATMRSSASCSAASAGASSAPRSAGMPSTARTTSGALRRHRPAAGRARRRAGAAAGQPLALVRPHDAAAVREIGQRVEPLVAAMRR